MKYKKKGIYQTITDEQRVKLLKLVRILVKKVHIEKIPIKKVAGILKMNYSTAKYILRLFRIEKRILRRKPKCIDTLDNLRECNNKNDLNPQKVKFN